MNGMNGLAACFTCNNRWLLGALGDEWSETWYPKHEGHTFFVWYPEAFVINDAGDLVKREGGEVVCVGVGALPMTDLYREFVGEAGAR